MRGPTSYGRRSHSFTASAKYAVRVGPSHKVNSHCRPVNSFWRSLTSSWWAWQVSPYQWLSSQPLHTIICQQWSSLTMIYVRSQIFQGIGPSHTSTSPFSHTCTYHYHDRSYWLVILKDSCNWLTCFPPQILVRTWQINL